MTITNEELAVIREWTKDRYYFGDPEVFQSLYDFIIEGLGDAFWYDNNEETMKRDELAWSLATRILEEVVKSRQIKTNSDTLSLEEIFKEADGSAREILEGGLDINILKDPKAIEEYLKNKTKGMTAEEIDEYSDDFGWFIDGFRGTIAEYVSKASALFGKIMHGEDCTINVEGTDGNLLDLSNASIYGTSKIVETVFNDWNDEESITSTNDTDGFVDENDFNEWIEDGAIGEDEWVEDDNPFEDMQKDNTDDTVDISQDNDFVAGFLRLLKSLSYIRECRKNGMDASILLTNIRNQKILESFYSDPEFKQDFKKVMSHDKKRHRYWFHGTQDLDSAKSILKRGLGMTQDELSSTAYAEMAMDDVLLYRRGLAGEIGRYAIVIIDEPINEDGSVEDIVQEKQEDYEIGDFVPSGLQGLTGKAEYIVMPQHIVGYIDKVNKKIILNPLYVRRETGVSLAEINEQLEKMQGEDIN